MLSYGFWQREFAGDWEVVGRTVSLDGHSFPVIGVAPPAFFGVEVGRAFDVTVPLCADQLIAEDKKGRRPRPDGWWLAIMGRLKPGWTVERANAQMQTLAPGIMEATLPPTYLPDTAKRYLANKLVVGAAGRGISGLRRHTKDPFGC